MKKNYKIKALVALTIASFTGVNTNAQCTITNLDSAYCLNAGTDSLIGTDAGGVFAGPGMTGDIFNPAAAGIGTHTITYTTVTPAANPDKFYLRSNVGEPWGQTTNGTAMDLAFGAGAWTMDFFESVDVATVFSGTTSFVFIDGSDAGAIELNTFLTTNIAALEAWVNDGGSLIINSAPNEGTDMDFGFNGSTLIYSASSSSVTVQDLNHPIYLGPNVPTASVMTGGSYSHAHITGTNFTSILANTNDVTNIVLCEKVWGNGMIMMGGMTTNNFHSPLAEAANWRANMIVYMDGQYTGSNCVASEIVAVIDVPTVSVTNTDEIFGNDSDIDLTVTGGTPSYTFDWDNDGTGDFDDSEDLTGLTGGTYTVVVQDSMGCQVTENVIVDSQVGIEESNISFDVYPNPAHNNITITLEGSFSYILTSINGDEVLNGNATDTKTMSLAKLASGVYFVTVKTNNSTKTIKVVKN
jgi:hypothetical protein